MDQLIDENNGFQCTEFFEEQRGRASDYQALMNMKYFAPTEYNQKLSTALKSVEIRIIVLNKKIILAFLDFSVKINTLAKTNNFTSFIELLKFGTKIARYNTMYEIGKGLEELHFSYFIIVNRPTVFDDLKLLNEVDQLHVEFYENYWKYLIHDKYAKQEDFQ